MPTGLGNKKEQYIGRKLQSHRESASFQKFRVQEQNEVVAVQYRKVPKEKKDTSEVKRKCGKYERGSFEGCFENTFNTGLSAASMITYWVTEKHQLIGGVWVRCVVIDAQPSRDDGEHT